MKELVIVEDVKSKIHAIRGQQVILDRDLAKLYGVETFNLNKAVKRNMERFPNDFMFQLNNEEFNNLKFQFGISSWGGVRRLPFVFTEQGVAILSGVLKSKKAIEINLQIMRAFVQMRKFISKNVELFQRIDRTEQKILEHDNKFKEVFNALETTSPKKGIFYDGQVFDAHTFVSDLIRGTKRSIVLVDNYVDDTVLTLFSKRNNEVDMIIYIKQITKQLKLDLEKYNSQCPSIQIKEFKKAHDRFLIIDDTIYHFGASLKDLGKKWFAFSKFEQSAVELLIKLNKR